ncbi:hypothetical protein SAMN05216198_2433 [Halopseudomonas litoralis]|uniref:PilX N-terminal n=1 Tax=Halopseudomonas litoralis TaxID=797277 RepID=A0A1H1TY14_9GAMM|nr:hypothetical protein [Halopseudomonas litoralis]SDS65021.1 hypothetical protein SAMN05216198_2433 [Halopseudomonas litoralis]
MKTLKRQRGIATVLTVVLLGLSLTSATLVGVSQLRSSQEMSVSLHAQTMAQKRAWLAAEAFQEYLELVVADPVTWEAFDQVVRTEQPQLEGLSGVVLTRTNYDDESLPDWVDLTLQIQATSAKESSAEATTTLEVVYRIRPPGQGEALEPEPNRQVILFRDGLNITGDLKVLTAPGESYDITVDGEVNMGGLSAGGIDSIRSTRSIRFVGGSSTDLQEMHANCDVLVSNGNFTVQEVKATRNACLANTINSQLITANGSVEVTGGRHGDIRALANKPGGTAQCAAGAQQWCSLNPGFGVRTQPSPTIANIYSKGAVEFNSTATVGRVQAEGNLVIKGCTPTWTSARYGGSFTNNPSCRRSASKSDQPVVLDPVPPVEVEPEVFDANVYRTAANYIYSWVNGAMRVKVQDVQGIVDWDDPANPAEVRRNGYFYRTANILDPSNPYWTNRTVAGYACINNNPPSRRDETAGECIARLGYANNDGTPLPEYRSGSWIFNGVNHAPGVVLVEGNMEIGNGTYTNTFIATGNLHVTTAGGAVFALNYAGPDGITVEGHTALGVCRNSVYSFRPGKFCESTYSHGAHGGLGNYALMAGSCPLGNINGCARSAYIGGDILVEKTVFGVTKAGNLFSSSGQARLYGYVSALAQRSNANTVNKMGASTTINLRVPAEIAERYDPTGGLMPADGGGNGGGTSVEATPGSAQLQWGRYL